MKKELKAWWEENKKKVFIAGGIAAGIGAAYLVYKKQPQVASKIVRTTKLPKPSCEAERIANAAYAQIDEYIFTELAPAIEDIVLEPGGAEDYISKVFTVPFPKGGNFKEGLYEDKVLVEVFTRYTE